MIPTRPRVLLATSNPAKQDALRKLLDGCGVEFVLPDGCEQPVPDVEEDGGTHLENASQKAVAFSRAFSLPAIASDGGLEIPALGKLWDGRRSRRFAGPDDEDRITALLRLMHGIPAERRVARFREAAVLADPNRKIIVAAETLGPEGRIAEEAAVERVSGFWIPSLWLYPPRWVTEWELTPGERQELKTAWDALREELRPGIQAWLWEMSAGNGSGLNHL